MIPKNHVTAIAEIQAIGRAGGTIQLNPLYSFDEVLGLGEVHDKENKLVERIAAAGWRLHFKWEGFMASAFAWNNPSTALTTRRVMTEKYHCDLETTTNGVLKMLEAVCVDLTVNSAPVAVGAIPRQSLIHHE